MFSTSTSLSQDHIITANWALCESLPGPRGNSDQLKLSLGTEKGKEEERERREILSFMKEGKWLYIPPAGGQQAASCKEQTIRKQTPKIP